MLSINNISKTFDFKTVIKGVHLSLSEGEIIHLIGDNGSGKTTLLKIIAGILKPESGEANIFDKNILGNDSGFKKDLIYWGHQPMLYPSMTTIENLDFFLRLRLQRMPKDIDVILEKVGLQDYKNSPCYKYSRGMFQRFNLLRLMTADWKLALMDEPLSGLDSKGGSLLLGEMEGWKNKGQSMLIASHESTALNKICTSEYKIMNHQLSKEF